MPRYKVIMQRAVYEYATVFVEADNPNEAGYAAYELNESDMDWELDQDYSSDMSLNDVELLENENDI